MTEPQTRQRDPTHAGVVAFRQRENRTLYLIVSSSNGAHWVLPKGHIEPGETPIAAALRELKEEAGAIGEILAELSVQEFRQIAEAVVVQFFLVRELSSTPAGEKRSLRWEDEGNALRLLSFAEARNALSEGAATLRRLKGIG